MVLALWKAPRQCAKNLGFQSLSDIILVDRVGSALLPTQLKYNERWNIVWYFAGIKTNFT